MRKVVKTQKKERERGETERTTKRKRGKERERERGDKKMMDESTMDTLLNSAINEIDQNTKNVTERFRGKNQKLEQSFRLNGKHLHRWIEHG